MIEGTQLEGAILHSGMAQGPSATEMILGSMMVEEFDQQLNSFNAELIAMNENKIEYREHRDMMTENASYGEPYSREFDGNLSQDGMLYAQTQFQNIQNIAKIYGYSIESVNVEGGGQLYFVPTELIDEVKSKIDNKIQDLNSLSEIKMVQFQSLMDSRKQAMMMLSNLMNSSNQTKMAIIQNMKG